MVFKSTLETNMRETFISQWRFEQYPAFVRQKLVVISGEIFKIVQSLLDQRLIK